MRLAFGRCAAPHISHLHPLAQPGLLLAVTVAVALDVVTAIRGRSGSDTPPETVRSEPVSADPLAYRQLELLHRLPRLGVELQRRVLLPGVALPLASCTGAGGDGQRPRMGGEREVDRYGLELPLGLGLGLVVRLAIGLRVLVWLWRRWRGVSRAGRGDRLSGEVGRCAVGAGLGRLNDRLELGRRHRGRWVERWVGRLVWSVDR